MKKWIGIFFFIKTFAWEGFVDEQDFCEMPFLFVSLGSHCEPAVMLRFYEQRRFAYPFDWLVTIDSEGMISLLSDDFQYFLDRNFMFTFPNHFECIENSLYRIEFKHDGALLSDIDILEKAVAKYGRRINRFRQLRKYTGKVFFVRTAYDFPHCGPTYWLSCEALKNLFLKKPEWVRNSDHRFGNAFQEDLFAPNLNFEDLSSERSDSLGDCFFKETFIDSKQARALKDALDRYFPKLDFTLIVLNYLEDFPIPIEESDNIIEFKIRKAHRHEDYKAVFSILKEGPKFFTVREGSKTIHR